MDPTTLSFPFLTRNMLSFEHATSFSLIAQIMAEGNDPIELRGFTREGSFTFSIVPTTSGTEEQFIFNIPDIPIAVSSFAAPVIGSSVRCHVTVHLGINGGRMYTLFQGFIGNLY